MDPYGPPRKRPRGDVIGSSTNGNVYSSNDLELRRYIEDKDKDMGGGGNASNRTKPCTKFFSTSGCPYGEGCHFLHYLPGGVSSYGLSPGSAALAGGSVRKSMTGVGPSGPPLSADLSPDQGANLGGFKTRLCNRYDTSEGCRYGDKCHFAHGERELRKSGGVSSLLSDRDLYPGYTSLELSRERLAAPSISGSSYRTSPSLYPSESRYGGFRDSLGRGYRGGVSYREPTPPGLAAAASFGALSTAKISIEASFAGAIIGKCGVNAKNICRQTGAKLSIRDHESDPNLRNVEMEGSFEQIQQASSMVRQVLMNRDAMPAKPTGSGPHHFKTKICENYSQGTCAYGERCHFAHGETELREHTLRA